ncbi:MAG: response regulator [Alphaproteobacteria bacterium]|nr:response regulator [Alphaproteobacteria bacterium]
MDILSINADTKLVSLASSIGQSPQSWRGWHCVQIMFNDMSDDLRHECLFWIKSFIEAYLKGAEGRVYFCEDSSIHILCKNVPLDVLEQAGKEICNLVYSESSVQVDYQLYDLEKEGMTYAQDVLKRHGNIFCHSSGDQGNLESAAGSLISLDVPESHINNTKISTENTKVMLVEDDPVTRWLVRNTLKDECDLITAPTANKAFTQYMMYQPEIVFLDVNLPDKSGYEVLQWIIHNDPGACVVMFSSQSHMDNIRDALEAGASGFIGKPFIKDQLLDYIQGNGQKI